MKTATIHAALKFIALAGLLYIGGFIWLAAAQRSFIYFPDTQEPDIAQAPFMEWVEVQTSDELTLKGWYHAPEDGKATLVYFHGNAGNMALRLSRVQPLAQAGYGVLLAEYRGYGGNPGTPTEDGLYKDGRAYIDWLGRAQGLKPQDMILYGESLGTGVAVQMATEYKSAGVVLEAPYSSVLDVASARMWFYPFIGWALQDQFRSDQKIRQIHAPLYVAVAGQDRVIAPHFGRALFDAAAEPKTLKVYERAGHSSLYDHGFGQDLIAFIEGAHKDHAE